MASVEFWSLLPDKDLIEMKVALNFIWLKPFDRVSNEVNSNMLLVY